jgi:cytokinin riboside 5'-monophosphate phosphoribohydrolase
MIFWKKGVFMHRICVYTGTNKGVHQEYQQAARDLAQEMVRRGIGLVYGGGRLGLMGIIADTIMEGGGEVTGVIPVA